MFGFLMRVGGTGITIDFHQHEPRRVVLLLQNVKAQDAQFQQAPACVEPRRLFEVLNAFRFDMDMNVNNNMTEKYAKTRKCSSARNDFYRGDGSCGKSKNPCPQMKHGLSRIHP